jgi:molybdate transport system ATP-binding protein
MNLQAQVVLRRGPFALDVNLRIEERVTGLFGPSGSGKTTLLHILGGLLKPDAGRVTLNGEILQDSHLGVFVPPHRRRIGMVFQDERLFPHLRVRANLAYGYRLIPPSARQFPLSEVVDLMELEPLMDRWPSQLSGGERQRVALGRSILASPRLLLLDEPLASLDRRLRRQIAPFLRRIRDATPIPIIYVSHDPRDILDLTDRCAVLEGGRLLGHGGPLDFAAELGMLETNDLLEVARKIPLRGY